MHRRALTTLVATAAIAVLAIAPSAASAWAPADSATIHPGVQMFTSGAHCTTSFAFQDAFDVRTPAAAGATTYTRPRPASRATPEAGS